MITTRDLFIREVELADWRAMHEYAKDPEAVKYEPWGPNTEEESRAFAERCLRMAAEAPRKTYEMVALFEGTLIGGCAVHVLDRDAGEGAIAYILNRRCWGRGFATQMAGAMLDFGFDRLALRRMTATCAVANVASARVLEKAGLLREGTLRAHRKYGGIWQDSHLYAILRDDERPRGQK